MNKDTLKNDLYEILRKRYDLYKGFKAHEGAINDMIDFMVSIDRVTIDADPVPIVVENLQLISKLPEIIEPIAVDEIETNEPEVIIPVKKEKKKNEKQAAAAAAELVETVPANDPVGDTIIDGESDENIEK